jgi:hypothetical protein
LFPQDDRATTQKELWGGKTNGHGRQHRFIIVSSTLQWSTMRGAICDKKYESRILDIESRLRNGRENMEKQELMVNDARYDCHFHPGM